MQIYFQYIKSNPMTGAFRWFLRQSHEESRGNVVGTGLVLSVALFIILGFLGSLTTLILFALKWIMYLILSVIACCVGVYLIRDEIEKDIV